MDRNIEEIPCIQIQASDWLKEKDVVNEWIKKDDVATWDFAGDVFTIYDHGDGPDSPHTGGKMPLWLWNEIEKIVNEKNIAYCIIRLMDIESTAVIEPEDPAMPLLRMIIEDLGEEPEARMDTREGSFADMIKKIVKEAGRLKEEISNRR